MPINRYTPVEVAVCQIITVSMPGPFTEIAKNSIIKIISRTTKHDYANL